MHTFDTLDKLPQRCSTLLQGKAVNGGSIARAEFDSVVIVATGEAALAAQFFHASTLSTAVVPVAVSSGAVLPRFVGPDTLVVALSETGSDDVTVSAVSNAADAEAEIVVVAPGGHLTDMAEAQGYPRCAVPHALISGAPLTAELFFGLWGLLAASSIGSMLLPPSADADARAAIDLMTRQRRLFGPEAAAEANPARMLVDVFRDRQPLIYGTSILADAAAALWAERLRQTGLPAYAGNLRVDAEAEGWPVTTSMRTPSMEALVLVDSGASDTGVASRLQAAFGKRVTCNELSMDGRSALERLWGAVYLAEWTGFYLAP